MCERLKMPDGNVMIVCGLHRRRPRCGCGRVADLACDWKMKERKSGTCDRPICRSCAFRVGPEKDLCPQHKYAYAEWLKRHPGAILPPDYQQMSLLKNEQ
jgi:hypothetical protein